MKQYEIAMGAVKEFFATGHWIRWNRRKGMAKGNGRINAYQRTKGVGGVI